MYKWYSTNIYMKEKITKVQASGPSIGFTTGLSSQHILIK